MKMEKFRIAIVGLGATGTVLSAALLRKDPAAVLVGKSNNEGETLIKKGIRVTGKLACSVSVANYCCNIAELRKYNPNLIFISTKTCDLARVIDELATVCNSGTKIVSTHNGLGTEDLIADRFGADAAFRMSLNFGVARTGPGEVSTAFFNPPNHVGAVVPENFQAGQDIANLFNRAGLSTVYVDDIKLYVWKKMVMKCTMASICAVTDKTIKEALQFPPTREIADACFKEIVTVAAAKGYHLGENDINQAVAYLEKAGVHKDSMCTDIERRKPTEIDFLGGKVVAYAREMGISVPFFTAMTNLVKSLESNYLGDSAK
jgi:2-dehydropantoate 2-reductase